MSSLPESSPLTLTDFPILATSPNPLIGRPLTAIVTGIVSHPQSLAAVCRGATGSHRLEPERVDATVLMYHPSKLNVRDQSMRVDFGSWLCAWALITILSPAAAAKAEIGSISPQQLVREAVQNEISSNGDAGPHFMFRDQKRT